MPRFLIAVFSSLLFMPLAHAQAFWKGSAHGMSVEKVQSIFPDAAAVEGEKPMPDGSVELLSIPSVQIDSKPFSAGFYFKDGGLHRVMLHMDPKTSDYGKPQFDSLEEILRAKYGQPIAQSDSGGMMISRTRTWLSGKTSIVLYLNEIQGAPAIVNVIYDMRVAASANDL